LFLAVISVNPKKQCFYNCGRWAPISSSGVFSPEKNIDHASKSKKCCSGWHTSPKIFIREKIEKKEKEKS
jgi:hypothetical protein